MYFPVEYLYRYEKIITFASRNSSFENEKSKMGSLQLTKNPKNYLK